MENPTPTSWDAEQERDTTAARPSLKFRHASRLAKLMEERQDLRGVHALADLVDDSLRWSA